MPPTRKRLPGRPKKLNLPAVSQITVRDRILTSAETLFSKSGFGPGVSIREVARAAGVDVALISHYFKNKDGLKAAVIDSQLRNLIKFKVEPLSLSQDPVIFLKNLIQSIFDTIDQVETRYRVRLWAMAEGGAAAHSMLEQSFVPLVHTLRAAIKKHLPLISTSELEARALILASLCEDYAHLRWTYSGKLKLQSSSSRLLYEFRKVTDEKIVAALMRRS